MLAEIKVAIDSLKVGTEIVRGVYAAQSALSEAELKLKMADLIVMLADARVALVTANDRVTESQAEVETLRAMLETRFDVVQYLDAMYEVDESGGARGSPYCIGCYESTFRLRHLTRVMKGMHLSEMRCPHCSNSYSALHAPVL